LRKTGEDPFGKEPSENISKKVLDAILVGDDIIFTRKDGHRHRKFAVDL
jgi:hypothetical protein